MTSKWKIVRSTQPHNTRLRFYKLKHFCLSLVIVDVLLEILMENGSFFRGNSVSQRLARFQFVSSLNKMKLHFQWWLSRTWTMFFFWFYIMKKHFRKFDCLHRIAIQFYLPMRYVLFHLCVFSVLKFYFFFGIFCISCNSRFLVVSFVISVSWSQLLGA